MKFRLPNTALFMRTLTADNRHWQAYAFRLVMMIIFGIALLQIVLYSRFGVFSAVGRNFFQATAHINLAFISLFGISLFSTAVTEEKEIDSLGLLMMTGISSFSMLISKSSSKMLVAMMLIIAQIPFTLLAITLGGIGMDQIICSYITILCYTFLVTNIALFASVIAPRSSAAAAVTMIILCLLNILSPCWAETVFLSPFLRIYSIMQTGFSGSAFTSNEICNLSSGLLLFLISLILFNYFSRTATTAIDFGIPGKKGKNKWKIFKAGRTWKNAVVWKDFYFSAGGFTAMVIYFSVAVLSMAFYLWFSIFKLHANIHRSDLGTMMLVIGYTILILQGAYLSSNLFSREVWEKTHSTLMLLPMTVRQVSYRKIFGSSLMLIPMFFLIVPGYLLLDDYQYPNTFSEISILIAMHIYFITLVICYYHLVTFFSLYVRHGAFAIAAVLLLLLQVIILLPLSLLPIISMMNFDYEIMELIQHVLSMGLYLFLIFFLHRRIGKKLIMLAGQ